jgi:hypothetical protein
VDPDEGERTPHAARSATVARRRGRTIGSRRTVGAILVALGVVMLIVALAVVILAAAGANDDVGVTWSNNAEARRALVERPPRADSVSRPLVRLHGSMAALLLSMQTDC